MNMVAVTSLFMQFNYKSDCCNDGQEAIEAIKARIEDKLPMYKLIMMDFSMPVCNGPTATRAIRSFLAEQGWEKKQQPLICCLSAYNEQEFKDKAFDSGMDLFLIKPIFKNHIS